MKALLICPAERPCLRHLTREQPLVLLPLRGRTLLDCWLDHLAARGATHVTVLAADRPDRIRSAVGEGRRWGLRVELIPVPQEPTPYEARHRFCRDEQAGWLPAPDDVVLLNHLPDAPQFPLDGGYAEWFTAAVDWINRPPPPWQLGGRELAPGVWAGLRVRVAPSARLLGPAWIGDDVIVGANAVVGPRTIVENRSILDTAAHVENSHVGPDTLVGPRTFVSHSLVRGNLLLDWKRGSCLEVPDRFLLSSLTQGPLGVRLGVLVGRVVALAALLLSAPLLSLVLAWVLVSGRKPGLRFRIAARPTCRRTGLRDTTFVYREFSGLRGLWRRWPQLWSVVRGDLAWFGNRPLSPAEAGVLSSEFERLWLTDTPGLLSLADACGCPEGLRTEGCAHASYYAVHSGPRLNASILWRILLRILTNRVRSSIPAFQPTFAQAAIPDRLPTIHESHP